MPSAGYIKAELTSRDISKEIISYELVKQLFPTQKGIGSTDVWTSDQQLKLYCSEKGYKLEDLYNGFYQIHKPS